MYQHPPYTDVLAFLVCVSLDRTIVQHAPCTYALTCSVVLQLEHAMHRMLGYSSLSSGQKYMRSHDDVVDGGFTASALGTNVQRRGGVL
jgi:hypothetical protein